MTNEDILKAAIKQAIGNGFDLSELIPEDCEIKEVYNNYEIEKIGLRGHIWIGFLKDDRLIRGLEYSISDLLFNHPFMKALCGDNLQLLINSLMGLAVLPDDYNRLELVRKNILEV